MTRTLSIHSNENKFTVSSAPRLTKAQREALFLAGLSKESGQSRFRFDSQEKAEDFLEKAQSALKLQSGIPNISFWDAIAQQIEDLVQDEAVVIFRGPDWEFEHYFILKRAHGNVSGWTTDLPNLKLAQAKLYNPERWPAVFAIVEEGDENPILLNWMGRPPLLEAA